MFLSDRGAGRPWRFRRGRLDLPVPWLLGVALGRSPFRPDPRVDVALVIRFPELTLNELLRGRHLERRLLPLIGALEACEVGGGGFLIAELDHPTRLLDSDDPSAVLGRLVHPHCLLRLCTDRVVERYARSSLVIGRLRGCIGYLRRRAGKKNCFRFGRGCDPVLLLLLELLDEWRSRLLGLSYRYKMIDPS